MEFPNWFRINQRKATCPPECSFSPLHPCSWFVFYSYSHFSVSFQISALGSLCNSFLFYKFITKKPDFNGFQKICLVKSAANFLICASFLFWVVPVTLLSYTFTQLNYYANRFVGTLSPTWAYYLSQNHNVFPFHIATSDAHLQVCLACNRFYALYFPFGIKIWRSVPIANISIGISVVCSSLYSLVTLPSEALITLLISSLMFPVGCGYVYDPDYFVWRGEHHECSKKMGSIFPYTIFGTTLLTNAFNVATGSRLLVSKISGLSKESAEKRKRRWMIMFAQVSLDYESALIRMALECRPRLSATHRHDQFVLHSES